MESNKKENDILDALKKNDKVTDKVRSSDYSHDGRLHTEKTDKSGSSVMQSKMPTNTMVVPQKSVSNPTPLKSDEDETGKNSKNPLEINSHREIPKVQISKSTLETYVNRSFNANDLKYVAKEVSQKAQDVLLSGKDDLGVQTVGMSITTAKSAYKVFNAIEKAEPMMAKASVSVAKTSFNVTKGVAKASYNVGKQAFLSGATVGVAFAINKGMNTKVFSKETWETLKNASQITGLSNTEISKAIVKCAESTVSACKTVYNGGKAVKDGAVNTAKAVAKTTNTIVTGTQLASYTISKSFNVMKANNTFPISKDAFKTLKLTAESTGLTNHQLYKSIESGVNSVKQGVINGADSIKNGAVNTARTVIQIGKNGVVTVKCTINVVKGVANGTIPIKTVAKTVGTGIVKGVKTTVKGGLSVAKFMIPYAGGLVRFGGKFALNGLKVGKVGLKRAGKLSLSFADALSGTDDMALQGIGMAIQTSDVALRFSRGAIKTSVQAGKGIGKVGIKTGTTVAKGVKGMWETYKKTNSLMKMFQYAGKAGGKGITMALKKAGGSIVNMMLSLIKTAGKKVIIPLIIIVLIACCGDVIIAVPSTVVGSVFSGVFGSRDDTTDVETEFEVNAYLTANVPTYSNQTRTDISNNMTNDLKSNGGSYDLVRLKDVGGGSGVVDPSYAGVSSIFYTDTEIVDILEPIFNTKMVIDYDMSPKDSQAKNTLKTLYEDLFEITTVETMEYCGQDLLTGEGTPLAQCSDSGNIHANFDCPNPLTGTHTSYTDSHCCNYYYTCKGHKDSLVCGKSEHTHNWDYCPWHWQCECGDDSCDKGGQDGHKWLYGHMDCTTEEHTHKDWSLFDHGCYGTSYHTNDICINGTWGMSSACGECDSHFYCVGYSYCNGHKVHTYSLNLDGIYGVLKKEIYDPISDLENTASTRALTEDEQNDLNNLYDAKEIYEVMAQDVFNGSFGGGVTKEALNSVVWHNNGRTGNNDVVNLAIAQSGSGGGSTVHGETYWSYMGYTQRISWSGCFVHWCMRNSSASSSWNNPSNYSTPSTLANQFTLSTDIQNAGAGDVIFLDWDSNGTADRMGIVVGTDSNYIYTVEGDVGDEVKILRYELSSTVIKGVLYMSY